MLRLLVFLMLTALSVSAGIAHAQAPVTISSGDSEVSILADRMEELSPDVLIATGNVEVTRGSTRLLADRVEFNRATGDAAAAGRMIFYDGKDRLTGARMDYNVNTGTGVIYDGDAFSSPYYRLSGERLERVEDNVYRVYRGVFTTCQDDPPTWSFHVNEAVADFDSYLFGTNASVWIKRLPVVPFVPFIAAALRRERQTGFLIPTIGESSRKGVFAKIPFFWAISDSQDLTASLDAFSERGVGGHAEYRYILSKDTQGSFAGFGIYESAVKDDVRGYFRARHNWTIDPTLTFRADINHASDDAVFREYGDLLHERSLQRADSNVFLTKRSAQWNFVANLFWFQDLTTPHPTELQRLPELKLTTVRQPLPGLPRVLWEFESSATHFVRDAGSEGDRLDLHPRAIVPFRPLGLFTLAPFVGVRTTTYDRKVVGFETLYHEDLRVERTEDALRTRALGEVGADLEAQAFRIYDVNAGGIARINHQIEPRVNYTFTDGVNKDDLPQFDDIDKLGRTNKLTYSLTNRLFARTAAGPDERSVRWELARFVLANTYDLDVDRRPFGDITADLIVDPNRHWRFRADAAYSLYHDEAFRHLNSDISLLLQDVTATVGTRFDVAADIEFYRAEVTARLSRNLVLRGATYWDAEHRVFVENRVGADLLFQCWAFALTYVSRTKNSNPSIPGERPSTDHEFRFSLDLLGVGNLHTAAGLPQ